MSKNIAIIGTLDTKGPEIAYLRDRIRQLGFSTTVIDSGILGHPIGIEPDIDRETAATYGNTTLQTLQNAGSRGKAVAGMRKALRNLTADLYQQGKIVCSFWILIQYIPLAIFPRSIVVIVSLMLICWTETVLCLVVMAMHIF